MISIQVVWLFLLIIFSLPYPTVLTANSIFSAERITAENIDHVVKLATLTSLDTSILDIAFNTSDDALFVVEKSGNVSSWNIENDHVNFVLKLNNPIQVAFSPNVDQMACQCGTESPIDNIEVVSFTEKSHINLVDNFGPVNNLEFSLDGEKLAVAGGWSREESRAQIWKVKQAQLLLSFSNYQWVSKVRFSPMDNRLIAIGYAHQIELWDEESNLKNFALKQVLPISEVGSLVLPIADLTFNSDASQIASMSPQGYVWIWNMKNGETIQIFQSEVIVPTVTTTGCPLNFCELIFSPNNELLITSTGEEVTIWDVPSGELLRRINEPLHNLTFNSVGTLLAASNDLGIVSLWGVG